ncbi:MAG: hypothetical protein ABL933_02535 [Methyloglobulus sp.]|nr:hypothetical protein [Methyloglobulus sp.]
MKNIKTFREIRFTMLTALAAAVLCGTSSYAQTTLIGSPGAGWQTWTTTKDPNNPDAYIDLDDDFMPFWDSPWGAYGSYSGSFAEKNAGFCMISDGDCQGIGSALFAPGALPFWAMPYDAVNDTGGTRDNKVYFHTTDRLLRATLFLNSSSYAREINEFGWFETDPTGSAIGTRHILFQGTGDNNGTLKPDRIGKTVVFAPTPYFGYYYNDVSEPSDLAPLPPGHGYGCYTYTLFDFVEARCLEATGHQGDHDFVVFKDPRYRSSTFWIAGEDPVDCANQDGDCNLTMVKVSNN